MAIIKFVTQGDRYLSAKGIKIWKDAERGEICPGRTYWSMNERFKKIILPNLDRYNLDEEQREKLDFLTKASTDGKYFFFLFFFVCFFLNKLFFFKFQK